MMCAVDDGEDACQGDSGGPLIVRSNENTPETDVQVGIVSWGFGCADRDFPGVYSRISYVKNDFFDSVVCEMSDFAPDKFGCDHVLDEADRGTAAAQGGGRYRTPRRRNLHTYQVRRISFGIRFPHRIGRDRYQVRVRAPGMVRSPPNRAVRYDIGDRAPQVRDEI